MSLVEGESPRSLMGISNSVTLLEESGSLRQWRHVLLWFVHTFLSQSNTYAVQSFTQGQGAVLGCGRT